VKDNTENHVLNVTLPYLTQISAEYLGLIAAESHQRILKSPFISAEVSLYHKNSKR
jgi:hypothetical protein